MRELFTIGSITIYWYGVLYVVAFVAAYFLLARLQRYRGLALSRQELLELVTWGAMGVVVGGRLGYVLLYELLYFLANPLEIFQLSQGGMSSHGGFVGVGVSMWFFFSWFKPPSVGFWSLLDVLTIPAALGLVLGRVGNLINGELYLTPLAQVVAVAAPLSLALLTYWTLRRWSQPGVTTGLFLVGYSLWRFMEEFIREEQWPVFDNWLTWGQVYTLPLLAVGLYLLKDAGRYRHTGRE